MLVLEFYIGFTTNFYNEKTTMSTIQSIQFFVALNLLTIGLSHFLQPKIWEEFFNFLYKKGNIGNIFNALIALGMGSFILSFHFVWKWPMVLVTLYGVAQLLKGFVYLILPSIGLSSIRQVEGKAHKFKWVGLVMIILSILLFVKLFNNLAVNN